MSDNDIEFEYESDENISDEDQDSNEVTVEIDNAFYEAEDNKESNPKLAIEQFQKVIQMEQQRPIGTSARCFKALLNVVILNARLGILQRMREAYSELLATMDQVTRNEAADAIDAVLASVPINASEIDQHSVQSADVDLTEEVSSQLNLESVYAMTLEALKNTKNFRLWFNTSVKLAKLYLSRGDVQSAQNQLRKLRTTTANSDVPRAIDGTSANDDECTIETFSDATVACKGAVQLLDNSQHVEVSALEIQLCVLTRNLPRMKEVLNSLNLSSTGIADPRTLAVIADSAGKMYMNEKKWDKAQTEFLEAFKGYQESGNSRMAKQILKCLVLANILSLSQINPFDSTEAKVYQNDPEISAMRDLRVAFDNSDVKTITNLLCDPQYGISNDNFLKMHIGDLLRRIRLEIMQRYVKPYRSIQVEFLAAHLSISTDETMFLLVKLATDKKLNIRIDDVRGVVQLLPENGAELETRKEHLDWAHRIGVLAKAATEANRHLVAAAFSSCGTAAQ